MYNDDMNTFYCISTRMQYIFSSIYIILTIVYPPSY